MIILDIAQQMLYNAMQAFSQSAITGEKNFAGVNHILMHPFFMKHFLQIAQNSIKYVYLKSAVVVSIITRTLEPC